MKTPQLVKSEMKEKVLTVIVDYKNEQSDWSTSDSLREMEELVKACDGEVVESVVCHLTKPSARCLIGEGKVEEIAQLCLVKEVDTVIFSQPLKGSQQRNIEEVVKAKTIDRTQLILDIFARHASSKEGKMQVELAQLEYLRPRLVGKGIELSRLGGGIGTMGPGETKLEVDRRRISERITRLTRELQELVANRNLTRKKRKDQGVAVISLVGYTNAGKSTLLNALTDAGQVTKDGLFTTLDSLSRQLVLPNNQAAVLSDTVGFIHDLPHDLIEAFKATLEEVHNADVLLHVVDVSHPNFRQLYDAVIDVLKGLNVLNKPTVVVFNKIDRIEDQHWFKDLQGNFEHAVTISALKKINLDTLLNKIVQLLSHSFEEIDVNIPINRMDLVNMAHKEGQVYSIKYYNDQINIRASVPSKLAGKFNKVKVI